MNPQGRMFFVLISALIADTATSGIVEDSRTVTVQGTALQRVLPDTLVWNLNLSAENLELSAAMSSVEGTLKSLMSARENLELSADEFQAGNINVNKEYRRDGNGNQEFKGYRVSRSLRIVQSDLKKFDIFLKELTKTGDVELNLQYEASTMTGLRAETRLEAVKAAREKAEAMASVLGATVGKVLKLDESTPNSPMPFMGLANNTVQTSFTTSAVEDLSTGAFSPSAMEVRVTVQATFELN